MSNNELSPKIQELHYWLDQLERSCQSKIYRLQCMVDEIKEEIEKKERS
jgi:hypothetical protein